MLKKASGFKLEIENDYKYWIQMEQVHRYTYRCKVRLADTDAAGLLFFASQFNIIHNAYEAFMDSHSMGMGWIIRDATWLIPIVHAEADYMAPLFPGDDLLISIILEKITTHSFTLKYEIRGDNDLLVGTCKTVHVSISKSDHKKIQIPDELLKVLTGV